VSGFPYRLFSSDGDELGEFVTAVPDWKVGDECFSGGSGRERFRIVAIARCGRRRVAPHGRGSAGAGLSIWRSAFA
jgi:hypothetical protein